MANFGDDLFAAVCLDQVSRWIGIEQALLVAPPVFVGAPALVPAHLASVYRSPGFFGKALRAGTQVAARKGLDLLVEGGGSLFKDVGKSAMFADRIGGGGEARRAAIGVSIGPFAGRQAEKRVRDHLQRYEYVSVRDEPSRAWMEAQDFPFPWCFAGDLVGALTLPDAGHNDGIGIAPLGHGDHEPGDGSAVSHFYDHLLDSLKHSARETGETVEIFALHAGFDVVWAEWFAHQLMESGIRNRIHSRTLLQSRELAKRIGACRVLITGRLHGAIVAYMQNVPFYLIEYEEKCGGFLDDIGQSGQLRISDGFSQPDRIQTVVNRLLDAPAEPTMSKTAYAGRSREHFGHAPWAE